MNWDLRVDVESSVRRRLDADMKEIRLAAEEVKRFVEQLCGDLSRDDFRLRLSESRIKETPRILKKLARKEGTAETLYSDIGDLIGLRVVVYNEIDITRFKDALRKSRKKPLTKVKFEDVRRPSGYRAVHINGLTKGSKAFGCEIQVRTALQDAWGVATREDFYDTDDQPDPFLDEMARAQADIINAVDNVMQHLRTRRDATRKSSFQAEARPSVPAEGTEDTDRTTTQPPTLDHHKVQAAREALTSSERHVLENPVSPTRVDELKQSILSLRHVSPLRLLLSAAGSYEREHVYDGNVRFGNTMVTWKGPFVDGANWGPYRGNSFADALERFLEGRVFGYLNSSRVQYRASDWTTVVSTLDRAREEMEAHGFHPDVILASSHLPIEIYELIDWSPTLPEVRGHVVQGLQAERRLAGLPLIRLWEPEVSESLIAMVDLAKALSYIQTNPDPMDDEADLFFRVDEITFDKAIDLLQKNPEFLQPPEGQRLSREEQVVRLQLQVILNIVEGGRLTLDDPEAITRVTLPPSRQD